MLNEEERGREGDRAGGEKEFREVFLRKVRN